MLLWGALMANWICEECGSAFVRDKSGARPIRFCGTGCYRVWQRNNRNSGQFAKGAKPWNAGVKGLHFSPATEFKPGRRGEKWLPVGTVTERTDKGGNVRASARSCPRARSFTTRTGNTLNDSASNLQALTRAEHIAVHRDDLYQAKRLKAAA